MSCRSIGRSCCISAYTRSSVRRRSNCASPSTCVGDRLQRHRIDEHWLRLPRANHARRRDVVRHSIHPGPHRAAAVETGQAAPQRHVNLLEEIAAPVRVTLVGPRQPLQRAAIFPGNLGIEVLYVAGRPMHSGEIVAGKGRFLQVFGKFRGFRLKAEATSRSSAGRTARSPCSYRRAARCRRPEPDVLSKIHQSGASVCSRRPSTFDVAEQRS